MSKEHKFSFDVSQHNLEYLPEMSMFKIDETLVPISNIREVLLEEVIDQRVSQGTTSGVATLTPDSSEDIQESFTTVKRTRIKKV